MSELFLLSGFSNALVSAGLDPDVRATLSESPIQEMCEELVGHELVVQNYTFAKPVYPTGRPKSEWSHLEHGHLDGYTRPGVVHSFTIGVTVNINDVEPKSGAFTVWPGTHRSAHAYFRTHSLLDGLKAFQDESGNYVGLPEPVETPGLRGSTVFWHSMLMHESRQKSRQEDSYGVRITFRPQRLGPNQIRGARRYVEVLGYLTCGAPCPVVPAIGFRASTVSPQV